VPVPRPPEFGGPTVQLYTYDDLNRLIGATGTYQFAPNKVNQYAFSQSYDTIHNIVAKDQVHQIVEPSGTIVPQHKTTYDWAYAYAGPQPHAPTHIGDRTFTYDADGNQTGWTDDQNGTRRTIVWDEENRIQSIFDNGHEMTYKYNDAGERVIKRGPQGETAYVNQYFTIRNREVGTKHVIVGTTRLVSKMMKQDKPGGNPKGQNPYEKDLYFYHPDHLGSSNYVTDADGELYEHLEYFPFGEAWVEEASNTQRTPYRFTSKELDEETELYYFGARYYDPRTSVWQNADPLLGKYLPIGMRNEVEDLAGLGGVYNSVNNNLLAYAGQNPLTFRDPDGNVLVIQGWRPFVAQVARDIRKLAPAARIDRDSGKVTVGFWETVKAYLTFDTGTKLIASLARSGRTTTIVKGAAWSGWYEEAASINAFNWRGTNATVNYDFWSDPYLPTVQEGGVVARQRGIPTYICLGHELIHALHDVKGTARPRFITGGLNYKIAESTRKWSESPPLEEIRTMGLGRFRYWFGPSENALRRQHNLPERGAYYGDWAPKKESLIGEQ
jgi:RHS repeat-associated protein